MFSLKVTIEVVDEVGNVVNQRGYSTNVDATGVNRPLRTQQLVLKDTDVTHALIKLNSLFSVIDKIQEFAE